MKLDLLIYTSGILEGIAYSLLYTFVAFGFLSILEACVNGFKSSQDGDSNETI